MLQKKQGRKHRIYFHDEFEMATILFAYAAENLNKKLGIKMTIFEFIEIQ